MRIRNLLLISILLLVGRSDAAVAQNAPGARDHLGLAYDSERDRVVLFGGNDVDADGQYTWNPTTWEWDGTDWHEVDAGTPGAMSSMSMAFDPASEAVLSMGGISPERGDLDETWLWDGTGWSEHTASTPGTRMSSGLAFDARRNETVLFSGCVGRNYPSDTWAFRDRSWSRVAETGPPGVCRPAMFFDNVRQRIVLFGGALASGERTNGMWEWDGEAWSEVDQGALRPSPRANMSMVYDTHRQRAVLYGGSSGSAVLEDLWEWDGNQWMRIAKQTTWPGPREVHGLTYHPGIEKTLLYGGRTAFAQPKADFWAWDGRGWEQLADAAR